MAGNFGDAAGGFRHNEVVSFINNEVLLNGGGPDFYTTLRSQSWNEIEDRLQAVLTDPQVPRMRQRACAWSALALGVRVAARQYEHQVHRIQQLQNQVEERKTISWALTSQLRQMLKERDQAASKLQGILTALQQAKGERDTLSRRLNQVKVSTPIKALPQAVQPVRRDQPSKAPPWPMTAEKQGKMAATGAHNTPLLKTPVAALGGKLCQSGNPSTWAPAIQPLLPILAPGLLPVRAPLLPTPRVRKAEGAVAGTVTTAVRAPLLPTPRVKAEGAVAGTMTAAVRAPLLPTPRVRKAEGAVAGTVTVVTAAAAAAAAIPKIPPLLRIYSPDFCAAVGAQKKIASLSDQRVYPVMPQKYLLGNSKSQGQEKGPVMPQGYYFLGNSNSLSKAKGPVVPQWKYSLGNSKSHGQGKGQLMLKCPEKQQPQGQKAKQAKGIRASEFQHQGMTASPNNRQNWDCSWCKMINYSWCKFCCKCKKVRMAVQSGGLRP
ncbi:unnamed protein product [Pipistrellus nathusii]|uniref:RanBP2-type domain-containing protein n=1 Tax=Pipistrellus nathusii TaxID=59473 RepID=A0ABP0AIH4_PIPNA